MKNISLSARLKKVGNSLAFFIPAEVRDSLGLKESEVVQVEIRTIKNKKKLLDLFGVTRKKLGPFTEEDRLDVRY